MALFDIRQDYSGNTEKTKMTFKDYAEIDTDEVFFNLDEFAEEHTVDGKPALIVLQDDDVRQHSSHWEAGAKQNFDTGLYTRHKILYIKVEDYGPLPKEGKQIVIDSGTKKQRTFTIKSCGEEGDVYRMTLERTRQ